MTCFKPECQWDNPCKCCMGIPLPTEEEYYDYPNGRRDNLGCDIMPTE